MKAIELLKEYDVNPRKFVVVIVDSDNIQIFLNDENVPHKNRMIDEKQLLAFVPVSKPSFNNQNEQQSNQFDA